ncbi:uncharacterized protein K452DRAFT_233460 [Aplosporella prunicola CBS 121167]|uniref:DUF221-domain-containing protein n=1 Tax=Aplosporella prunicola CBS 121167 TaxID=1176127 RepID=A0A6A6B606_9PEZI|nr:uncharacterized protein K452DRAFT_233460 [Aplosporella prunicola CBS 121167]KAF2138684.1 hypothetical protein K452DRAFT_233460 [Aplosporella prunicola CBS 121167]
MSPNHTSALAPRDDGIDPGQRFVDLISQPFNNNLNEKAFESSLAYSSAAAVIFALLFCLLRPYNTTVYAPRLKHADEKHAPPPVQKGIFAWVKPVVKTREEHMVQKVGIDATVFIRFTKMCRNIFIILALIGNAVFLPVNLIQNAQNHATIDTKQLTIFMKLTPMGVGGGIVWTHVCVSYIFNAVIYYFLWTNYKAVLRLRRNYFDSPGYQASLHARTLLITDIPKNFRTDEGVVKITDGVKATSEVPRGAIARNMKELPDLIEEHEDNVRELEEVLATYLKNPDRLPARRPTCKTNKADRNYSKVQEVDAIDYLTSRIKSLEIEITEVRESVDNRNALQYGFASYESIEEAHGVAYASRHKHPEGSIIRVAPKPGDLIWKNLPLDKAARRWRGLLNNIWVTLLTIAWTVPNALIAVFLSNLGNLASVWPAFAEEMGRNPHTWAAIQGILAPLLTTSFYFFLPIIFRRLSMSSGDYSKTSRERHVTHKLYAFFIFNNLFVFSLFSAVWQYVSLLITTTHANGEQEALKLALSNRGAEYMITALCYVSPFWLNYLLQRNFGAAWDISQLANLAWGSIVRKFSSPTPRRLIELTAPPAFDYACYYNYFLYYSTIALVFTPFLPLVLLVVAFYFTLDSYLKKYLLLYVFITKHESGGSFWRVLYNRMLFATFLGNLIMACLVGAKGSTWSQLICMGGLPLTLIAFKWYCRRTFDDAMHYYSKGNMKGREENLPSRPKTRGDRLGVRFGHPALYKPLMTPMVHAKSEHLLSQVYRGRLEADTDGSSVTGYSDTYSLHNMSRKQPGKKKGPAAPFELVTESEMDFEHYKNRPEFREEFGGDGEMYSRPGTPGTYDSRPGTPAGHLQRIESADSQRTLHEQENGGSTYPEGYHTPMPYAPRAESPLQRGIFSANDYSDVNLVEGAAPMGATGRGGYGRLETPGSEMGENTSYDYFRRGKR